MNIVPNSSYLPYIKETKRANPLCIWTPRALSLEQNNKWGSVFRQQASMAVNIISCRLNYSSELLRFRTCNKRVSVCVCVCVSVCVHTTSRADEIA